MFNESWIIYEVLSGSHSYGLNTPESDEDWRGIMIPPIEYFISPFLKIEQYESKEPDRSIYEIRKFVNLATQNNPNILELLWVDDKHIKTMKEPAKILRDNRDLFLSAKCRWAYAGYSMAQLKRIKSHKKYLLNPVTIQPKRSDFGLSDNSSPLSNDEYGIMNMEMEKGQSFSKEIIAVFEKEKQYRRALQEYNQYQTWKKTRNPKRAELESKYFYDTKHATHLVRLMCQGKEILLNGTLTVDVSNIPEIQEVKNGKWSYEKLMGWAENADKELAEIYDNKKYVIPHSPDTKKIDKMTQDIISGYLGIK